MNSRLHLHGHTGPKTRGYVIGEPQALRSLARALQNAANGALGFETIKFYGSDGHEYELVIACDVAEEEWQALPLPNVKTSDPNSLAIIKSYNELKNQ